MRDLTNLKLYAWHVGDVQANVEENINDIDLAVCYADHGDEFLYICTKDGEAFTYGWFINRPFCILDEADDWVLRRPIPGVAGKIDSKDAEYLSFDEVSWVYKDGIELKPGEYYISYDDPDEWGVESGSLSLDQFADDALEKVRRDVVELKAKLQGYLDELNPDNEKLPELLAIRDQIGAFIF